MSVNSRTLTVSSVETASALSEKKSVPGAVFGYLCKLVILAFSAWGIMSLICSTAGIELEFKNYTVTFLICTVLGSVSSLLLYGRTRDLLCWIGVIILAAVGYIAFNGGVTDAIITPAAVFYDRLLFYLSEKGFSGLADYMYDGQRYGPGSEVYEWGTEKALQLICIIVSFFSSFSLSFHTVLPFYYGMTGFVLVGACCYNVFDSDIGFMAVVSCLIAAAVMSGCNKRFKGVLDIPFGGFKKNFIYYSKSGICGLLTLFMCVSLWAVPAAVYSEPWEEVPLVDGIMISIRDITTKWLSGESDDDFDINTAGNGSTVDFSERKYGDRILGNVYTLSPDPLYLRTVTYENYDEGKWEDDEDLRMTPELLTEFFMDVMGIMPKTESKMIHGNSTVQAAGVGIELGHNGYIRLPVPFMSSQEHGICDFGKNSEYSLSNWYVHNGDTFAGTTVTKDMRYSTVHYSFSVDSDNADKVFELMNAFDLMLPHLEKWLDGRSSAEMCEDEYEEKLAEYGLNTETVANHIFNRKDTVKNIESNYKLRNKYIDLLEKYKKYERYVYESFANVSATPLIIDLAEDMKPKDAGYWISGGASDTLPPELWSSTYDPADAVYGYYAQYRDYNVQDVQYVNHVLANIRKYFYENCEYTTEPKVSGEYREPVNEFLFGKKEGYCVHYATAAAALLRACGIPARYAEGYLISNLSEYEGEYGYSAQIKEESAHAWVEYYLPGFGWQIFEATSVFARANEFETIDTDEKPPIVTPTTSAETTAVPDTSENTTDIISGTEPSAPSDTTGTAEETAGEESDSITTDFDPPVKVKKDHTVRNTIIAVLCITAVCGAVFPVITHRSKELEKKRSELGRAIKGDITDGELAVKYTRRTLELLKALEYVPGSSELSIEFAKRCGTVSEHVHAVVCVYQKHAFYGDLDGEDISRLVKAYIQIEKYTLSTAKKRRLILLRIKGRI